MSASVPPILFRAPSTFPSSPQTIPAPPLAWIEGSWNVTHSTLPMWKKSRNVRITYKQIPDTTPVQLDDEVSYQALTSTKLKTVNGVDKPFEIPAVAAESAGTDKAVDGTTGASPEPVASLGYNWRGKGLLMIASSKWEILGYGDEDLEVGENQWVATYFAKTMFTPAGVDFYSRKGQLKPDTVERLKAALVGLGGEVAALATQVFAVALDGDRAG